MLLAPNFEYTKTPRESFQAAYDCCLAQSAPPHTPSGAGVAQVECKRSGGDFFRLIFCTPNFDHFRPLQPLLAGV